MTNRLIFLFLIAVFLGTAIDVWSTRESDLVKITWNIRCSTTQDCTRRIFRTNLQCEENQCVCKSGYHFSNLQTCIEDKNIGDDCSRTDECWNIEYAGCYGGKCNCPEGITFLSSNKKACLFKADEELDECSDDKQCESLPGSRCTNGECRCLDNHRYSPLSSKCIPNKYIGDDCSATEECWNIAYAECYSRKCNCLEDRIPSSNNRSCLRKAKKIFDICSEEQQCESLAGSRCTNGRCWCPNNHHYNQSLSSCILSKNVDEACLHDYECSQGEEGDKPTFCMNGICKECSVDCVNRNGTCVNSEPINYKSNCWYRGECSQGKKEDEHTICMNHTTCIVCDVNCVNKNGQCAMSGESSVVSTLFNILLTILRLFIRF